MIRQAIRRDFAEAVPLIWQAIGDLAFLLTGTSEVQKTVSILSDFFQQENNRLSYQNALVMEEEGHLVGLVLLYDGAKARELDLPLERAAAARSGDLNYHIPTEPGVSEFYLDTLSVIPRCQGRGYGRILIEAGCDRARRLQHSRIALLVEVDNPAAKRLYDRLGFRTDYTRLLAGHEYFHMVRSLEKDQSDAVVE
jgi:ribosomal protein S18 acetylase RimI-like enzyme